MQGIAPAPPGYDRTVLSRIRVSDFAGLEAETCAQTDDSDPPELAGSLRTQARKPAEGGSRRPIRRGTLSR